MPDAEVLGGEQLLERPKPYSSARSSQSPNNGKATEGGLTLRGSNAGHASIQSGAERVCDVFGLLSKVEVPQWPRPFNTTVAIASTWKVKPPSAHAEIHHGDVTSGYPCLTWWVGEAGTELARGGLPYFGGSIRCKNLESGTTLGEAPP